MPEFITIISEVVEDSQLFDKVSSIGFLHTIFRLYIEYGMEMQNIQSGTLKLLQSITNLYKMNEMTDECYENLLWSTYLNIL